MRKIKWTPLWFACAAIALGGIACGDDSDSSASPTGTPVPTHTLQSTAHVLTTAAPEVQQLLALAGFQQFAGEFAAAVESNDAGFFIDRGYLHPEICGGSGIGAIKCPSGATNVPVNVISVGAWNSEGDYYTKAQYDDLVASYLSAVTAPHATTYALGHQKRFAGETEAGVDILVSGVGLPAASSEPADPKSSLNFQVQPINGVWRITRLDRASTTLAPEFFDWYAPWHDVFPTL